MLDINPIEQTNEQNMQGINKDNTDIDIARKKSSVSIKKNDPLKWDQFMKDDDEFIHEKNDGNKILLWFTILIAIIVLVFAVYLYFLNNTKQEQINTLDTEQEQLYRDLKDPEIASISEMAQRFSVGITDLKTSLINDQRYSNMLINLQKIVPNNVVLDTYSVEKDDSVKIIANLIDLKDGAQLIKNLSSSGKFKKVTLVGVQLLNTNTKYVYSISLTAETDKTLFISKVQE